VSRSWRRIAARYKLTVCASYWPFAGEVDEYMSGMSAAA
jgi:hypothetical protein